MLKNTLLNKNVIKTVAKGLGELNQRVVYVGGAVVSMYINDPAADDVRPTIDIDISLEIASFTELEVIRKVLRNKGFSQTADEDIICRFRYKDIKVDVMSTREIGWAPANIWFEEGFKFKEPIQVDEEKINILPLPYFLASKFTAYHSRGGKDPRTSHDFEDIIYIIDNQTEFVEILNNTKGKVLDFLKIEFKAIIASPLMREAVLANLYPTTQIERMDLIITKLNAIID
jgi:predicted nucleotidyltransferase